MDLNALLTADNADRTSPLDDDIVSYRLIKNPDTLAFEADLFGKKWFDYRMMTPMQATRLYIEAFATMYKRAISANVDVELAQVITPTTVESLFKRLSDKKHPKHTQAVSKFKTYWHGRQVADLVGMPYDLYVSKAMELRLRYWKQRHLPQPAQMYSDMIMDRMPQIWLEHQSQILLHGQHAVYLNQNYQGLAHQDDHHEWLLYQGQLRHHQPAVYAQFLTKDLISYEKLKSRIDPRYFERVCEFI